jgi:DMSO/TMAO reductase YedYZ molybdopterin-dependent catalytic subunit
MFVCVCRWGQLNAFAGVALRDLIARARPTRDPEALYLLQRSVAGPEGVAYEASISLGEALANDALLAYEMDGRELSLDLGWPLRLVDFHLYGYKTVKCLGELRVTGEFRPGWWETERQYDPHGMVRPGTITMVGDRPSARRIDGIGRVELSEEETAALAEASRPAAAGGNP